MNDFYFFCFVAEIDTWDDFFIVWDIESEGESIISFVLFEEELLFEMIEIADDDIIVGE